MKKLTALAVGALSILAVSASAQAEITKVRMGTEGAYPPFNQIDKSGKLTGFDIEIGNALCDAMKVECEWVTSDWDGIIPALLAKKFDTIVASMSITDERKKKIAFTGKYYTTPVKFVAPAGSKIEITKEGLKGKIIGVQSGVVSENFVRGTFGDVAEVKAYGTQDEANLDFAAGRVDLLCADSFVLADFLKTADGKSAAFIGPEFNDPKYLGEGIGIGVRQEDNELREMLNKAIAQIRADGTYEKINKKYFDFDVYGE